MIMAVPVMHAVHLYRVGLMQVATPDNPALTCIIRDMADKTRKPNLLFVFPDQMRGSAMGFLGEENAITPHLDRFAAGSRVLTQAASNFPVCSSYRAMLMTGQYPHRNGVTGNVTSLSAPYGVELRAGAVCWSDVLRDAGYSLGYIGKWHLDSPFEPFVDCANNRGEKAWNEWCPPERRHGFDYWHAYGTYDSHLRPLYWSNDAPRDGFHYVDQWGPEYEADRAIEYLQNRDGARRDSDAPFALVVSMNPPHTPYEKVPPCYVDRYAHLSDADLGLPPNVPPAGTEGGDYFRQHQRNQLAMITGVDEQFGRILAALDETGLAGNTLVIFTSDHGDMVGRQQGLQPFGVSLHKPAPFEEAMRVPFLLRFRGVSRREATLCSSPRRISTRPCSICSASVTERRRRCRAAASPWRSATSRMRSSQRRKFTRRTTLLAFIPGTAACAMPPIRCSSGGTTRRVMSDGRSMIGGDDPCQLKNQLAEQPGVASRLASALDALLAATGDSWPAPQTPASVPG